MEHRVDRPPFGHTLGRILAETLAEIGIRFLVLAGFLVAAALAIALSLGLPLGTSLALTVIVFAGLFAGRACAGDGDTGFGFGAVAAILGLGCVGAVGGILRLGLPLLVVLAVPLVIMAALGLLWAFFTSGG